MISSAIAYLNDRDLQQANTLAVSLHGVAATIAGCNGVKQPSEATEFVNPYGLMIYRQEAKAVIPTSPARTMIRLWDDGRLPGWVMDLCDRKLFEAAAS